MKKRKENILGNKKIFGKNYAKSYDFLYQDKDYESECDFIERILDKYSSNVKTILDLGCGTGGHGLILQRRGYRVTAVDRSKEMIDIADRKARESNLPLKIIESDITKINLKKFDAVISMFSVISYQTTNPAISRTCRVAIEHLVPGGIFLFDCWNGLAVLKDKPKARIKEIKLDDNIKKIRVAKPLLHLMSHTVKIRYKLFDMQDGHINNETTELHLMRFFFPEEIRYFLEVAGFKEIKLCPFLKLNSPLTEDDWNMTVIARK